MELLFGIFGRLILTVVVAGLSAAALYIIVIKWIYEPFLAGAGEHPWRLIGAIVLMLFITCGVSWKFGIALFIAMGIFAVIYGLWLCREKHAKSLKKSIPDDYHGQDIKTHHGTLVSIGGGKAVLIPIDNELKPGKGFCK